MFQKFMFSYLLLFYLNRSICYCEVKDDSEEKIVEPDICGKNGYVIVATIDGNLSSIDFESGKKCWTTILDKQGIFSSSLYKLEVWENGTKFVMIPSLDGALFRYDKVKLEPLPFNAELFLSQSASFDQSTYVTGGKFKVVYGINQHSGEIFYTCSVNGCRTFSEVSTSDALVIELLVQSVSAVDSMSAEQKWHFKVAELQIKVMNSEHSDNETLYMHPSANNSAVVSMKDDLSSESHIKISLLKGYAARKSHSHNFIWLYQASTPIIDAWYVKEKAILLDPFADETEFFSIDSHDGEHSALLFLGCYMNEFFVKQSKKLKSTNMFNSALSKPVVYKAFCLPLQINGNISVNISNGSEETNSIVLANPNLHEVNLYNELNFPTDNGFYFYIEFSVLDNDTHCLVDFKYPKVFERIVDYLWVRLFTVCFAALACLIVFFQRLLQKKKKFTSEGTSTTDSSSEEKSQDYISRFHKDFKLISILGKGGFGVVMEAKNVIDDCKYAIKRIQISSQGSSHSKEEFVLREVKALAKLDHPGIVRYFNSWVEYPPIGWQELSDKSSNISFNEPPSFSGYSSLSRSESTSQEAKIPDIVRKNPLNPFEDILESSNFGAQFDHGQLSSDYSLSSSPSDSSSSSSSASNSSEEDENTSSDDSDDSIVFSYQPDSLDFKESEFEVRQEQLSEEDLNVSSFPRRTEPSRRCYEEAFLSRGSKETPCDKHSCYYYNNTSRLSCEEVYDHLIRINKGLAYPMQASHLQYLTPYLFSYQHGFGVEQWMHWISIAQEISPSEVHKYLKILQTWLISVLIHLQQAKSNVHQTLCFNLCNLLWDVELSFEKAQAFQKGSIGKVRQFNSRLSYPMKLLYLEKIELYLFQKHEDKDLGSWEKAFYRSDQRIFTTNLYIFRMWLISMLCHFNCEKDILSFVKRNLSYVLCEVNNRLKQGSFKPETPSVFFEYYKNCFEQLGDVEVYQFRMNFSMFQNVILYENRRRSIKFVVDEDAFSTKNETIELDEQSVKKRDACNQYNLETNDSFLYIQMQLCRRDNLRKWLDFNYRERDYAEVMSIFTQIVDAIDYVHAQGLMHRDLKPSNIYFSMDGTVKIGDFGLATQCEVTSDKESSSSKLKSHTRECGTELYMSPEQSSKKVYDFKTDIFPLGIILYELLVPFFTRFERQKAIISARNQGFTSKFSETYPNEAMLARRLLEKDPESRPTASEIKEHPVCQLYLKSKM